MTTPSIWLPSSHSSSADSHTLIYFICGNPGLIEFYRNFLTYLRGLLDGADHNGSDTAYDIYGQNLPGFIDSDHEPFSKENPPWDLNGVIERMYGDVKGRRRDGGGKYADVILMGHSVGSFISVEIFHRHLREKKTAGADASELNLTHGFLLFPTVTHLALSPSGKLFTFLMGHIPLLERYAHVLARFIVSLVPVVILEFYISRVMGFAGPAAKTTVGWLKSRDGVWQTIWLAGDEMKMIAGEERWGEEIWESSTDRSVDGGGDTVMVPRFFMFYGKEDHWVADHVRDEFVERMRVKGEEEGGSGKGKVPRIVVDESGLKHAFCTKDDSSFDVAKRVSGWVKEIEEAKKVR